MFNRNRPDHEDRRNFGAYTAGRGGRPEYWMALAVAMLAGMLFPRFGAGASAGIAMVFTIRRLHDFGQTGWWSAMALAVLAPMVVAMLWAPVLGTLVFAGVAVGGVVFAAFVGLMPGDAGPNRFGDPPQSLFGRKRADLGESAS